MSLETPIYGTLACSQDGVLPQVVIQIMFHMFSCSGGFTRGSLNKYQTFLTNQHLRFQGKTGQILIKYEFIRVTQLSEAIHTWHQIN